MIPKIRATISSVASIREDTHFGILARPAAVAQPGVDARRETDALQRRCNSSRQHPPGWLTVVVVRSELHEQREPSLWLRASVLCLQVAGVVRVLRAGISTRRRPKFLRVAASGGLRVPTGTVDILSYCI